MGALPNSEPFAFRFAPYIKELREFLASSRLHYGSPEDIFPVTERLQNSKAFAEDMTSMVRSILLREGGSMAHAQLLEILAIAIGGPEMDQAAPQSYRQPLRQLLSFLTGVLRRPWNLPPGEEAEPPAPARVATYSPTSDTSDQGDIVDFPSGPSGPFATAAALAAAESRTNAPKPPARELVPPVAARETIETSSAEHEIAAAAPQPGDISHVEPEYPERDFAEYDALAATPPDTPVEVSAHEPPPEVTEEPAPETAQDLAPVTASSEPILSSDEAPIEASDSVSDLAQPAQDPVAETPPPSAEITAVSAAPSEISEFEAAEPPVETQTAIETTAAPAPESERALAETQSAVQAPIEPQPESVAEPIPVAEPAPIAEPTPIAEPPVAAAPTLPASALPAPLPAAPAFSAAAMAAKWPRHHPPGRSTWHDSPFDDSSDFEAAPAEAVEPAAHARPAAAPWVSAADDTPGNPPWISTSTRNVVFAGVAAIAVAILIAVVLRPTLGPSEPVATAAGTAPASVSNTTPNAGSTSLTPQPTPVSASVPAKPTAYGDPFTPQQNPNRPPRSRSSEDDDYTGSDVAPPHYRSFVTPATPAATTNEPAPQPSPSGFSQPNQQAAPVERRAPDGSPASDPMHQSFRGSGAAAGEARATRPTTPSRSLNGSATFRVSSGVMAANLISAPNPDYPTFARLTHTQGEVIIQAVISRDGHVAATHVLSGHRLLRGAAIDAVKRWRYRPYVADGHPVDVATIIRVGFHAHN